MPSEPGDTSPYSTKRMYESDRRLWELQSRYGYAGTVGSQGTAVWATVPLRRQRRRSSPYPFFTKPATVVILHFYNSALLTSPPPHVYLEADLKIQTGWLKSVPVPNTMRCELPEEIAVKFRGSAWSMLLLGREDHLEAKPTVHEVDSIVVWLDLVENTLGRYISGSTFQHSGSRGGFDERQRRLDELRNQALRLDIMRNHGINLRNARRLLHDEMEALFREVEF